MAATSAKRRREASEEVDEEDVQAIFRRAFEARFKPLPEQPKRSRIEPEVASEEDNDEDDEESDWSGISDDEPSTMEVVEYQAAQHNSLETDRAQLRAFMSFKPPSSSTTPTTNTTANKKADPADAIEATNLKNDLALQKLLRESRLLSASSSGSSTPTLSALGIARHKSTDLHMQALGAKGSVFAQKKMPMAQRKYEAQKARLLEDKRRASAREAGIVLEKETRAKSRVEKRDRGVGAPSVGRLKGGTLSLSRRDVRSITGGGGGGGGGGKGAKGKSMGKGKRRKAPF